MLRVALADQVPAQWVGGETSIPDHRFFETPAEIVAAADAHFR